MSRHPYHENPEFEEIKDIGRQIRDSMRSAINRQEFSELKSTLQSTMHDVQNSIKNAWGQSSFEPEPDFTGGYTDPFPPGYTDPVPPPETQPIVTPPPAPRAEPPGAEKAPKKHREKIPGSVAGILMTVFGGIGLGLVFLTALAMGLYALVADKASFLTGVSLGSILPLLLVCIVLLICGGRLRRRTRRYRQYQEQLGGCAFCPIEVLASYTGNTPRFVVKDLRKMIRLGMLPDAHVDEEGTCLMLDYETYQAYLNAKRKQEEARAKQMEQPEKTEELQALEEEENRILEQIRTCNRQIPGEFISAKITCLENTTGAIFDYVEEHPEKLPEIRRFLNYYLPTTLKLLETYRKFSEQPVSGGQQRETKAEIEKTMDMVNQAFANLLDSLMQEERMDVAADISVMKTMMEQEGLTGKRMDGSDEKKA